MVLYLFRRHVSKLVFVFFKTINFSFFFLFSPARCQPLRAAARTVAAVRRARWRNSNLSKCWQSLRQRPPISHARTRRRWPPPRFGASSGYRRCLRRFAAVMAAAPTRGAVGMGAPVRVKGETRVICTIVTIAGSQEGGKDIVDTRTTVMNCVPLLA